MRSTVIVLQIGMQTSEDSMRAKVSQYLASTVLIKGSCFQKLNVAIHCRNTHGYAVLKAGPDAKASGFLSAGVDL